MTDIALLFFVISGVLMLLVVVIYTIYVFKAIASYLKKTYLKIMRPNINTKQDTAKKTEEIPESKTEDQTNIIQFPKKANGN